MTKEDLQAIREGSESKPHGLYWTGNEMIAVLDELEQANAAIENLKEDGDY